MKAKMCMALILILCCSAFAQNPRQLKSTLGLVHIINTTTADTAKVQSLTGDFDLLNIGLKIRSTTAIDSFSVIGDTLKIWIGATQYNAFLPGAAPGGLSSESAWSIVLNNSGSSAVPSGVKISALTDRTAFGAGDKLMIEESTGELRKIDFSDLPGAGGGEINTASNLGGGLANFDSKSGVDLRFNSFLATDFNLAANQLSLDRGLAATWTAVHSFADNNFQINNPANTFQYIFGTAAIAADRTLELPLLTGNDTFSFLGLAQTFTGIKTISADWINTANPWADNEVSNTLTASIFIGSGSTTNAIDLATAEAAGVLPDANIPDIEGLSTSLTTGSVVFSDGSNLAQDNANFFWDDTNNRLGIGTVAPLEELHVVGEILLDHTAAANDEHALEINLDAAGFGDIKGVEVQYDTGNLSTGEIAVGILIEFNEIDAVGGDVIGLEILSTDGGADNVVGIKIGAEIAPLLHDSGSFINPTLGTNNTNTTNVPDMIDGNTGTNTTIFAADNDFIIIGANAANTELEFVIETGFGNPGIQPVFAFSTTGTNQFTNFSPTDGTDGFKNAGAFVVAWDADEVPGYVADDVTGKFDIRITRTANPAGSVSLFYAKSAATRTFAIDKDGNVRFLTYIFEGATDDAFEHTLNVIDPTADRLFNFPDDQLVAGDVLVASDASDLEYLNLANNELLFGDGAGIPTATVLSGDVTNALGVVSLADNTVDSGELVDGSIDESHLNVTNSGTDNFVLTFNSAGGNFTWAADATGGNTNLEDIGDPAGNGTVAAAETIHDWIWNTASSAAAADYFTLSVTHDATTDANTQRLLTLERKADGTGNQVLEALLYVSNLDDQVVTSGIEFNTVGVMTNALLLSDSDIVNWADIGANDLITAAGTITSVELDRLTGLTSGIIDDDQIDTFAELNTIVADRDLNAVLVADNESSAETNALVFLPGGDLDGGILLLESDGDLNYNPSTGTLAATEFVGGGVGITGVTASHAGTITWTGTSILESGAAFQFGDASDATLTHTYANTGTNVSIAYSSALFTFSHGVTLSAGDLTLPGDILHNTDLDIQVDADNNTANSAFRILDGAGNIIFRLQETGSIDWYEAAGLTSYSETFAVSGVSPTFTYSGGDVALSTQLTLGGSISTSQGATASGLLIILEDTDDGSNFASFQVPALAANTAYILPPAFGSAGFQLTDAAGDGVLSWAAVGGAGAHDGTITWTGTSILESGVAFGFGDGSDATLTHTYANTGTDVVIAYSTAAMAITGALTSTISGADLTTAGTIEIATATETGTGTDATRAISPDGFAGSTPGTRVAEWPISIDWDTDTATGDNAATFIVPNEFAGMDLVDIEGFVKTVGTTGTLNVTLINVTQANAEMLSTALTIDSGEKTTATAAAAAVIDTGQNDVAALDELQANIDGVHTTPAKGFALILSFRTP